MPLSHFPGGIRSCSDTRLTYRVRTEHGMTLSYHLEGSGEPLLLLHAFGLSHQVWRPVVPRLTPHRQVLLIDLPGHGRSPMPPPGVPPNPRGYARMIAAVLDELGFERIDVAGNSIGGWTGLELAVAGRASSVVALSPAGLWPAGEPLARRARFLIEQTGVRATGPLLRRLLTRPRVRQLVLGEAMTSAKSLAPDDAITIIDAYGRTKHMAAHLRARRGQRFVGGQHLTIPITVAYGAQDRIIKPGDRTRDQLPGHARWQELPGCGHVMMWDAPDLVARTILEGTGQPRPVEPADAER
jgi:pimeloyl-ACP methyl ester carboxylesterase